MHEHCAPEQGDRPGISVQGWQPVTVSLWPINPQDGSCSCANVRCAGAKPGKGGKHPRHRMGPLPGGGTGILTGAAGPMGSGIFVVDCDLKPGIDGAANFDALCKAHGMSSVPDTLIVATGGGGMHFYFAHPGFPVGNSTGQLAPGVDVKGDGTTAITGAAFVVGPGSPHPRGSYYVLHNPGVIAPAPEWLLRWPGLRKGAAPVASGTNGDVYAYAPTPIDVSTEEGQRRIECFRAECRGETGNLAPAIEGQGGSNPTLVAADRGCIYYQLPPDTVVSILLSDYNARCVPPWSEREIRHKVDHACQNRLHKISPGPIDPQSSISNALQALSRLAMHDDPTTATPEPGYDIPPRKSDPGHAYTVSVGDVIANGKLSMKSTSDVVFQLRRHPQWIGVLQYDQFSESIIAINPPVRLDCEGKGTSKGLSNHDITAIKVWFEVSQDTSVSSETLGACVEAAAKACQVHAIRDYLYGLPAGDPDMFKGLAARMFGISEIGGLDDEMLKRFLVGAVRRALKPGTKMDTMLILFGEQGAKKSTWIPALFGEAFINEQMPDLSRGTDASMALATVWAQEFPELDKMLKADPSTVKDLLSRRKDKYRPPYGREFVIKPRQSVLIGTTNLKEMLRDPTGERRSWIVEIPAGYKIDSLAIEEMRDQVWAAALALALDEEFAHWFDQGDEWDLKLKERQANYTSDLLVDGWTDSVKAYLLGKNEVTTPDIFRDVVCKGDPSWLSKFQAREQRRLGGILRAIGCARVKANVYIVPHELATAEARPFAGIVGSASLSVIQGVRSAGAVGAGQ